MSLRSFWLNLVLSNLLACCVYQEELFEYRAVPGPVEDASTTKRMGSPALQTLRTSQQTQSSTGKTVSSLGECAAGTPYGSCLLRLHAGRERGLSVELRSPGPWTVGRKPGNTPECVSRSLTGCVLRAQRLRTVTRSQTSSTTSWVNLSSHLTSAGLCGLICKMGFYQGYCEDSAKASAWAKSAAGKLSMV